MGDVVAGVLGVEVLEGVLAFVLEVLHGREDAEAAEDEDGEARGGVACPSSRLGDAIPGGGLGAGEAESLGAGKFASFSSEVGDGLLIGASEEVEGVGLGFDEGQCEAEASEAFESPLAAWAGECVLLDPAELWGEMLCEPAGESISYMAASIGIVVMFRSVEEHLSHPCLSAIQWARILIARQR